MLRIAAFRILARVRDELDAGRFALSATLGGLTRDGEARVAASKAGVTEGELRRCARNLEITFILRFFAEFEGILRDYWGQGLGRMTQPPMSVLMDGIAGHRRMAEADKDLAGDVRRYRNDVIHEDLRDARMDFPQCARAIGRYLRWLPDDW